MTLKASKSVAFAWTWHLLNPTVSEWASETGGGPASTYLPTYLPTYIVIEVHLNPVLSSLLSSRINIEKCSIGGGCSFLAFTLQRSLGSRPGHTCLQRLDDLIGPGWSWAWSGSCSAIKLSARPSADSDSDCDSFRSRPSPLSVKSRHYEHKCRINYDGPISDALPARLEEPRVKIDQSTCSICNKVGPARASVQSLFSPPVWLAGWLAGSLHRRADEGGSEATPFVESIRIHPILPVVCVKSSSSTDCTGTDGWRLGSGIMRTACTVLYYTRKNEQENQYEREYRS
ncbi:uncharacterized protein RAG0_00266 [Rhynchosporium agropyri]|uniref:Uncharacterized protein n=1 Tax=Rhynchosporium agropyri TaxID=914238 RepID=A0A1E1JRZ3_9HELO|nr:uncharacterized protein RAG0_00266 [Rhynchosporium agropyri]